MTNLIRLKQIESGSLVTTSSLQSFTESIDNRVDNLEYWSSSLTDVFATDLEVAVVSGSIATTIGIISQQKGLVTTSSFNQYTASQSTSSLVTTSSFNQYTASQSTSSLATTGSNTFNGNQTISGSLFVSTIVNETVLQVGSTVSAGGGFAGVSNKIAIFREDAFTIGVWTDVQIGWTVTDNNGFTDTIASIGNFGVASFVTTVNNWPPADNSKTYVFTSPNYQSEYTNPLEITIGNSDWVFDGDGGLTFPDETTQTTAFIPTTVVTTSSLQTFSQSIDNRVDNLEIWSSSLDTNFATDLEVSIVSSSVAATIAVVSSAVGLVTTSSFNSYTASQSTSSLVNRLNTIESVSGSWITESETGSFLTSLNGAISSSSQLTSSFDTRYTLSGSVQNIELPSNLVSGSSQLTSSFDTRYNLSGSSVNINTSSFATTGSNSFNGNQNITGSLIVNSVAVVAGAVTIPSASVISLTSGSSIFVDASGTITGSLTGSIFGIGDVAVFSASLNSRIISGSAIAGTISGSSQLTSSYDTRYTLSGSVVSGTTPAGTISGSSQLTSSYDGRYTQTGSFNTLTSSFNSFTASAQSVTTGSNTFNGTQTITGSLNITTGNIIASAITANTSSLYLTSGSNLYVQNNGIVEITGSLTATSITGSIAATNGVISGSSQLTTSFDTRYALSASFVSSSNLSSIQTITSASYAALTPVSGTLYIIIG